MWSIKTFIETLVAQYTKFILPPFTWPPAMARASLPLQGQSIQFQLLEELPGEGTICILLLLLLYRIWALLLGKYPCDWHEFGLWQKWKLSFKEHKECKMKLIKTKQYCLKKEKAHSACLCGICCHDNLCLWLNLNEYGSANS